MFLLPPDSVVRRSQPPLRPPDLALLVLPLLGWLPTADRVALVEHQPAAYAAAAKAHADGQAPRAAAAVAQVAASLSPPGPLHSASHSALSLSLGLFTRRRIQTDTLREAISRAPCRMLLAVVWPELQDVGRGCVRCSLYAVFLYDISAHVAAGCSGAHSSRCRTTCRCNTRAALRRCNPVRSGATQRDSALSSGPGPPPSD